MEHVFEAVIPNAQAQGYNQYTPMLTDSVAFDKAPMVCTFPSYEDEPQDYREAVINEFTLDSIDPLTNRFIHNFNIGKHLVKILPCARKNHPSTLASDHHLKPLAEWTFDEIVKVYRECDCVLEEVFDALSVIRSIRQIVIVGNPVEEEPCEWTRQTFECTFLGPGFEWQHLQSYAHHLEAYLRTPKKCDCPFVDEKQRAVMLNGKDAFCYYCYHHVCKKSFLPIGQKCFAFGDMWVLGEEKEEFVRRAERRGLVYREEKACQHHADDWGCQLCFEEDMVDAFEFMYRECHHSVEHWQCLQCSINDLGECLDGMYTQVEYQDWKSSILTRVGSTLANNGFIKTTSTWPVYSKMFSSESVNITDEAVATELADWGISVAQLSHHPSAVNICLCVIRHLNRIFGLKILVNGFVEMVEQAFSYIVGVARESPLAAYFSKPEYQIELPQIEGAFGMLSQISGLEAFFQKVGDNVESIAAVMAAATVGALTYLTGSGIMNDSGPLLAKFSKLGMSVAGVKRGLDAALSMILKLKDWIYEGLMYVVGKQAKSQFHQAIALVNITDSANFCKANVLEYVEYLINEKNLDAIRASDVDKHRLESCISVFAAIERVDTDKQLLDRRNLEFLRRYLEKLYKVRQIIFSYHDTPTVRFTPFWINFVGEAGSGKSTFANRFQKLFMEVLARHSKYEIPAEHSRRTFAINFTDKFMTDYNQHYCLTIDDVFQDTPGSLENPSAFQLISYISNVPMRTVQAALADKGIPFTSKLIVSTSNTVNPNRQEITDQKALKERIRVQVRVSKHPGLCTRCKERGVTTLCSDCELLKDPVLDWPVLLELMRLDEHKEFFIPYQTITGDDLMQHVLSYYDRWYDKEVKLMSDISEPSEEIIQKYSNFLESHFQSDECGTVPFGSRIVEKFTTSVPHYCIHPKALEEHERVYPTIFHKISPANWFEKIAGGQKLACYKTKVDTMARVNMINVVWAYEAEELTVCNTAYFSDLYWGKTKATSIDIWQAEMTIDVVVEKRQTFFEKMQELLTKRNIAIALGLFGAASLAVMFVMKKRSIQYESYESSRPAKSARLPIKVAHYQAYETSRAMKSAVKKIQYQSMYYPDVDDLQGEQLLDSLHKHASAAIVEYEDHSGHMGRFTVMRPCGRWLVGNVHAFRNLQQDDVFSVILAYDTKIEKICGQIFDESRYYVVGDRDIAMYLCDNNLPCARNIMNHIADEEIAHITTRVATLHVVPTSRIVSNLLAHGRVVHIDTDCNGHAGQFSIDHWIVPMEGKKGQSGSMLISMDPQFRKKIIGLHSFARYTGRGTEVAFVPLLASEIQEVVNNYGRDVDEPEYQCQGLTTSLLGTRSTMYIGDIEKPIHSSQETKYIPSVLHDPQLAYQQPAILNPFDDRLPEEMKGKNLTYRNMQGFDDALGAIHLPSLKKAKEFMLGKYLGLKTEGLPCELLDDFSMINGWPKFLERVDMGTSPGYPWVHKRKTRESGKREWFIPEEARDGTINYKLGPIVAQAIKDREDCARKGQRIASFSYACLKDETRPPEKIAKGKTRVFMCMPMDYNLLVRKYFGAFIGMMHSKAVEIPSCVGIDPHVDFVRIFEKLRVVGNNYEDFDYTGWDTSLHPELFMTVVDIVNAWYDDGEENGMARKTLISEIVYNNFIVGKRVFRKTTGNTSGCAITAELNSLIHELLFYYFYCYLCVIQRRDIDLKAFDDNVRFVVYGDDSLKNVSDDFKWFSGENIKPIAEQLGMGLTPGDKSESDFRFKSIAEVTFLKRSFNIRKEEVFAPLHEYIITDMTQWIHKTSNKYDATYVNCDMALREMAQNISEKYITFQRSLNEKIGRVNSQVGYQVIDRLLQPQEYYLRPLIR